uniref:Uncharacterized protein n=1 Tax=Bartonella rochalimae ATCC BAA-1498 TaxID=685782 RepID=E6YJY5_9HYPH|nr:hypothetical protein BARRO_10106 [Bartonella rochalimae ATCC BAA-1498]
MESHEYVQPTQTFFDTNTYEYVLNKRNQIVLAEARSID